MRKVIPFLFGAILGATALLLYLVMTRHAGWSDYKNAAAQYVAKSFDDHEPEEESPRPDKAFCSALLKELGIAPLEVNYIVATLLDAPTGRIEQGELRMRWNDLGVIDKSRIVLVGLSETDYHDIESTIISHRRFFKARDKLAFALIPCRLTIQDWQSMSPVERQKLEHGS